MDIFAERLKALRKEKNLKQIDMAQMLDVTDRHYQRMEYGKVNVPALSLIALADFFNVSLDYLVGRSDNPERR
jgi:transcriptional regulator with XRE-family HTH domain